MTESTTGTSSSDREIDNDGLSSSPQNLHSNFLSDLAHLQEIHDTHQGVIIEQHGDAERHFDMVASALSIDSFLQRFDGTNSDTGDITIPLHGCNLSGVKIEVTDLDQVQICRLTLTGEGFDPLIQTLKLPLGTTLSAATWSAGKLNLSLDQG